MDMVFISGQMEVCTKEPGIKIKFQNTVSILGMMEGLIKVTGLTTTCTVKVFTDGPTEENTKVIM